MKNIIKSLTGLTITIVLFSVILTSCHKHNEPQTDNDKSAPLEKATTLSSEETVAPSLSPTQSKKPSLKDIIINGDYTTTEDPQNCAAEWINMWLENTYEDNKISDAKIKYLSGAAFCEFSDSIEIRPMLYSVKLLSSKPIAGAEKQQDGSYILKTMVITVFKDSKTILCGFLGPDEFDEYDAMPLAYDVVLNDPRYSSELKPFPKADLPKEFSQIDMHKISGGRDVRGGSTLILPGEIATAICENVGNDEGKISQGISLFDIKNEKQCGYVDLSEYYILGMKITEGKLAVKVQKNNSSDTEIIHIDAKGNMTNEKYPANKDFILYSPDGSKYAYSDKGSLYVADVKSNTPKLLIKGKDSQDKDIMHCYPFDWYDNSMLVYGISGYEWSNGCGIINVITGKDTFFDKIDLYAPSALIKDKLYTAALSMEESFDPWVIDLSDINYSQKKLFNDRDFIKNNRFEIYSFSPDGTKIALLKTANNPYEKNTLYICSTDDGSILKKYEFRTAFSIAQYLDFFEDSRIAIKSERYALNPHYLYIVDIR